MAEVTANNIWFLTVALSCIPLTEPAVTSFGSLKPSNPTFVSEWETITLKWNYTIDGSIGLAQFLNATDDSSIASKFGDGDVTVSSEYQERFKADISSTLAQLTILSVRRSDSGRFKFILTTKKVVTISNEVELKVQYPADITHISGNQTVNETDVVTLSCSAEGMPTPSITWTRVSDNRPLSFPLTIAGKQDEGGYRCTVDNGVGNSTSQVVYIIVKRYHPIYTNLSISLGKSSVLVNTSFNITCSAQANPPAYYRFYKNQDSFFNDTTGNYVSLITTSVNKRIKEVNYSCTPFNEFGDGLRSGLTMTVLYSPSSTNLITVPNNTTFLRGSNISLDCSTDASPDAHIYQFFLNDNFIGNSSSVVFNTTVMADGVYTCVPVNTVGTGDNATVSITVVDPPSITINKTRQTVEEGNNITLTCNVTGKPQPIISWTELGSSEVLSNTSSLTIVNVSRPETPDNMIQYQCTASNGVGTPATATVNVTVHYAPSITNLITVPRNTTLLRESSISLDCSTDANPDAHIYQFYLNDNLIGNESSSVFNTSVSEDGVYTCVPINTVGTGENDTVSIIVIDPPSITINKIRHTVEERDNITLTCNASGKPQPSVSWTQLGRFEVLSNTSSLTIVNVSRPGTPENMIQYQCTASNGVETPATDIANVTVHYAPGATTLTTVPSNRTVLRGNILSLNCQTDASPKAKYHFYFNGTSIGNSSSGMLNTTVIGDGVYTCVPVNTVGTGDNATVSISVVVAPSVEILNETATVVEGEDFVLACNAIGKPKPSVTWTKVGSSEVLSNTSSLTIVNVSRPGTPDNMIQYQCIASNGVETPATATVNVTVHYPPTISSDGHSIDVSEGNPVSVSCPVLGNPHPTITWYKGNETFSSTMINANNILSFPETVLNDSGWYTCFAENFLGNVTVTIYLRVEKSVQTTVTTLSKSTIKVSTQVLENTIFVMATIDKSCDERLDVEKRFPSLACERVRHLGCLSAHAVASRCGSVIVDFEMKFNQSAIVSEVLNVLKTAAEEDNFDGFKVDPSSIKQVSTAPTDTTAAEACKCSCNDVILAAVVGVLVFIIIGLILYIVWLHKKGSAGKQKYYKEERGVYDNEMALDEFQPSNHIPSNSTQLRSEYMNLTEATKVNDETQRVAQSADYAPLHPSTRSWEVEKQHVTIEKIIGKGAFGQVAKGTAIGLRGTPGKTTVAVKMLKYNSPESDRRDLLKELDTMKQLKPHPHVIKLMGCVTEAEPLMVIIEYVPYGDLLGYLRKSRGLNDTYYKDPDIKPQTSLTSQQLMKFAWQIADGMSYLSSKSIIHRDLAARNVLVGERETCKVTDFGMARDVQQDSIYEKKTKGRLPVKWTAYEALLYGTYTTKSDIWSYGVVLYEIFTIGGSPYPRMDGRKIAGLLQQGYRMPKPQHVDDKLYQLMMKCWENDPEKRPTFTDLKNQLKDMENQHRRLINMKMFDKSQLYANAEDLVE